MIGPKIIINADDLGTNILVNLAIEDLIKNRLISSATIMSNGQAFDDATRIARQYDYISYGVHLNLDEFKPLTSSHILQSFLCDATGSIATDGHFNINFFNKKHRDAVKSEIRAQINKVLNTGIKITHIDTHHHIHSRNWIIAILIASVAKEFGINKIRIPISNILKIRKLNSGLYEHSKTAGNKAKAKTYKLLIFYMAKSVNYMKIECIRVFLNLFFKTTDFFYSYEEFSRNFRYLKFSENSVIELMCHPGHPKYMYENTLLSNSFLEKHLYYELINYSKF